MTTMFALFRIVLFLTIAALALVMALAIIKVVVALAAVAAVVVAGIFLYHFAHALFRRLTAPAEPRMLT